MIFYLPVVGDVSIMEAVKKFFLPLLILSFFLTLTASAQEYEFKTLSPKDVRSLPSRQWQNTLAEIKSDTQKLLEKNRVLNEEYEFLQEKLRGLEGSLDTLRGDIRQKQKTQDRLENFRKDQLRSTDQMDREYETLKKDIASLERENTKMIEELAEVQEHVRAWQLRTDALEAEKRELALDLRLEEYARQDITAEEDDAIRELKQQLKTYQGQKEELAEETLALKEQKETMPEEISALRQQNAGLEKKIAELKRETVAQGKENAALQRENQALSRSSKNVPASLLKEKRLLERKIEKLEAQRESIRKDVMESAQIIKEKRDLMTAIMTLDSQNQELRDLIAASMEKIAELEKDVSPAE